MPRREYAGGPDMKAGGGTVKRLDGTGTEEQDRYRFRKPAIRNFQPVDPSLPAVPTSVFPEGARMVYGIGAQKAGTSWLYDYLSQSGDVHFSPNKEVHYFDVLAGQGRAILEMRTQMVTRLVSRLDLAGTRLNAGFVRRLGNVSRLLSIHTGKGVGRRRHLPYLEYLAEGRDDQRWIGDITPSYAILDRATFSDMASVGEARFIFVLRDPVARMWSQVRMSASFALDRDASPEVLAAESDAWARRLIDSGRLPTIERANYLRTMTELEAAVPADRILYVFFEDLFRSDAPDRICDFLGIARLPVDAEKRVNEGVRLPIPDDIAATFRAAFDPQYEGVRARFGAAVPATWRD